MARRHAWVRFLFVGPYIALGLGALAYMLYLQHFDPAHSKFSGLPIIILTQPWSLPALTVLGLCGTHVSRAAAPPAGTHAGVPGFLRRDQ